MKTILLENGGSGMLRSGTKIWISKIDPKYILINSEVRVYDKSTDLWTFAMLIDPALTDLATMSAFPSIMGYEAERLNGREDRLDVDYEGWKQLEWYTWLIYEAVGFRKKHGMPKLTIHIAYEGVNFLKDVNNEDLGEDTKMYLSLMMRQSEGFVEIKLYEDRDKQRLLKTIRTEEDLHFTR